MTKTMKTLILNQANRIYISIQIIALALALLFLIGCSGTLSVQGQGYRASVTSDGKSYVTDTEINIPELLKNR